MIRSIVVIALCILSVKRIYAQASYTDISAGNPIFATYQARGVAVIDFDNDGDDDIFISAEPCRLYRNDGNLIFTDITNSSGITTNGKVSVWFDADNDGWLDVIVGNWTSTDFYHNNANGTFTKGNSIGIRKRQAFLVGDVNGDQWPDLYVANFREKNQVFFNVGGGNFAVNKEATGAEVDNQSMGGLMYDFDEDGDLDVYLVFDGNQPNNLFVNDGHGHFTEHAAQFGLNTKSNGMGVDIADFDHNGYYDIYISNLFPNFHLMSDNARNFTDISVSASTDDSGMAWGTFNFDYNNDSYEDIYCVNIYAYNDRPNVLYKNNGNGTYDNVAPGSVLEIKKSGYGGAFGDFDDDGLCDIVVGNDQFGGVTVLRNAETVTGNWIKLNLVGTTTNKFAAGAKVRASVNGVVLMRDIKVGSGYASQNSYTTHFGLGADGVVDQIEVFWPDGTTDLFSSVAGNKRYLIIQGGGMSEFDSNQFRTALTQENLLTTPVDTFSTEPVVESNLSAARIWNEALLDAIRNDFARPTVHARNLFHTSVAMYDAWAAYDDIASTYFLGQVVDGFYTPFTRPAAVTDKPAARNKAISHAAFRLLMHRFQNSPNAETTLAGFRKLFSILGYDEFYTSTDYASGDPRDVGNYIAAKIIEFGFQDGANELNGYANQYYQPVNPPFNPSDPGDATIIDPNRWQPITLDVAIDQSGNVIESTPSFLSPEWGAVTPFALTEDVLTKHTRDGYEYWVYYDPGQFPTVDVTNGGGTTDEYLWNFSLVSIWSSHLDPNDGVMMDVSPASTGNIPESAYPTTFEEFKGFYDLENGGDPGPGYTVNPVTGLPYEPQVVPRGDYARVLAEFWADGPNSETPPGHWFTILNYVADHPMSHRQFNGQGEPLDPLEWDVKAYFTLGGALHDVAISSWGIKGYYDGVRPVSAIRAAAARGQSSDQALPNYNPSGLPLYAGLIELVAAGDPLAGASNEHVGKIKLYAWRGPDYIVNQETDDAGVGWILAENWWPYQRPTFVSPPFAGYISGHSTYSRAGAEVLTWLTGDEYFPGGMSEFHAPMNEFLVFEEGPSTDIVLQWAKYKDASDQCSLSRIWGGIHPPFDDIPGRKIGRVVGEDACNLALKYFQGGIITDVEKEIDITLSLYPNPSSHGNRITIESTLLMRDCQLRLLDMTGRTLQELIAPGNETGTFSLSADNMQTGVYLLHITSGTRRLATKLIIVN